MKSQKKWRLSILAAVMALSTLLLPTLASADAIVGDTVVTLGKDLTDTQRKAILREMRVNEKRVTILQITNQEEYQYLGEYMSKATIGTKAISSAKITIADKGAGITVKTKENITTVTADMYANAATTAGIKDVDIYVTAPFEVSGTAGLTGITKAFEKATGQKIDEKQKQVANEEMVRTSEIASQIGDPNKATQFINRLKEEVAKEKPTTLQQYHDIIIHVSQEFNIQLNEQTIQQLTKFAQNFAQLNINWDQLKGQLQSLQKNLDHFLQDPQTKSWIDVISGWIGKFFSAIGDFFSSFSTKK
jgi:uncharacterized protein YpuA (DUF1002 family)